VFDPAVGSGCHWSCWDRRGWRLDSSHRDQVDPADPWGHIEGRFGGVLASYDASDGRELTQIPLTSAPAFDGLSACEDSLFLVTKDGKVICFQ
jgi:hypothetical protein